ncbi:hypothetical protein JST97_12030 [bacterium]|nr:hypothetical protein [bacterium]
MIYQPLALYWERSEEGQADPAEVRAAQQVVARLAQLGLVVQLDRPERLPELPEAPPDLMQAVQELLHSPNPRLTALLFPDLVAFHRAYGEELDGFRQLYPSCQPLIQAIERDLIGYQEAVGAMVEQDWSAARRLFQVESLRRHRRDMAQVRSEHGCWPEAALDELAWSCQRGRPQGSALSAWLDQLERECRLILDNQFPDPRLREEWKDLWKPRLQTLRARLARPELAILPTAQQWLDGQRHWVARARQQRDFSRLSWWGGLRQGLIHWFAGRWPRNELRPLLSQAECWLDMDLSGWPELDRELRQHHLEQAGQILGKIGECLRSSDRAGLAQLVDRADAAYDRWLWLSLQKA